LLANRIARFLSNKAAAKAQGTRLLALLVVASIAMALSLCDAAEAGCDAAEAGEIRVSNDAELLKARRGAKRGDPLHARDASSSGVPNSVTTPVPL
jgi:hypothetical protein